MGPHCDDTGSSSPQVQGKLLLLLWHRCCELMLNACWNGFFKFIMLAHAELGGCSSGEFGKSITWSHAAGLAAVPATQAQALVKISGPSQVL